MKYSYSFFFNDTATTEIYTLSLHDALPISGVDRVLEALEDVLPADDEHRVDPALEQRGEGLAHHAVALRSEEHTSELQSRQYLVCRLLLEKKKIPTCRFSIICHFLFLCLFL